MYERRSAGRMTNGYREYGLGKEAQAPTAASSGLDCKYSPRPNCEG
jgi:hypothetical protein